MRLDEVTPLILAFNEEPNLPRTLASLSWAKRIVVVDSGSSDGTLKVASSMPQVELFYRTFDHFADQCNYGLTLINTEWTRLDRR